MSKPLNLRHVADHVRAWYTSRAVPDRAYGTYQFVLDGPANFYASCDVAIIRWIIGERLENELSVEQRRQWADVINGFQSPVDGHYGPEMNDHIANSNGRATKAL